MKKTTRIIILITLVSMLVLSTGSVAFAKPPVKGEVTAKSGSTVVITTDDGSVTVTLPSDFDPDTISVGDILMAKGTWQSETEFLADWVKVFPPKPDQPEIEDPEDQDEDEEKGNKPEKEDKSFNSAYCSGEKDSFHPLAEKLVLKFGDTTSITAEQANTWYCEGYSIGHIMLALITEKMDGSPAADTLAELGAGTSWGKIWQMKGIIGSEKEGLPPGQLKKPFKQVPPGLLKKTPQP